MGSLRNLTISEQIGLLFVVLFGLLLLVTVIAFTRTLRDRSEAELAAHEQFKRDLRAVWVGAVLFWLAWVSGAFVSTLLFGVISFLALREFVTLTHTVRGDHRSLLLAFFIVLPAQYVIVATRQFDLFTVFIPVYVFLAIPVISAFGIRAILAARTTRDDKTEAAFVDYSGSPGAVTKPDVSLRSEEAPST